MLNEHPLFIWYLLAGIVSLVGLWGIFKKAGYAGWKTFIPIYNLIIIQKIIDRPWWWIIIMFIPYLGIIFIILSTYLLANTFKRKELFTLGLILLPFIFYPLLGYNNDQYTDPRESDEDEISVN